MNRLADNLRFMSEQAEENKVQMILQQSSYLQLCENHFKIPVLKSKTLYVSTDSSYDREKQNQAHYRKNANNSC